MKFDECARPVGEGLLRNHKLEHVSYSCPITSNIPNSMT